MNLTVFPSVLLLVPRFQRKYIPSTLTIGTRFPETSLLVPRENEPGWNRRHDPACMIKLPVLLFSCSVEQAEGGGLTSPQSRL